MAVNFDPAQPFAPNISERFGETEQYNKTLPTLAALYEAQGRNFTQASAGTAANITRASEESAKLAGDRINQDNQLYFQRQQQAAQIEAQKQSQIRDIRANEAHQFNQMAFQNMMVSDAEQKDMVRKQNGLALIKQQLEDGTLSDTEAADAVRELTTGVHATQQRLQSQQAQMQQQAMLAKQQQIASGNQDRAMAEKFTLDMAARGITMMPVQDKTSGKWHTIAFDAKSNRIYNPFLEHAGKEGSQKSSGRFGDEGGEFSYKNALPEAKAEAEAAYPVIKEMDPKSGKEVDTNAKSRAEYTQEVLKRMKAPYDSQKNPQQQEQPQQQQEASPEEQKQAAEAQKTVGAIRVSPKVAELPTVQKAIVNTYLDRMQDIMKTPPDKLTPDQKRQIILLDERLREILK